MNGLRDVLFKWSDCSRCQGVSVMIIILIIAAFSLDAQSLKEILIAAVSFSAGLANIGAGVSARGPIVDAQTAATSAAAVVAAAVAAKPGDQTIQTQNVVTQNVADANTQPTKPPVEE